MTLYRYILREILPTFFTSLLIFIFIMVAARMLSITELIITRGVRLSQVFWMVVYLLPDILGFVLPAVTLLAVVIAFLRLSVDSEIIALKSSGISLYQMLPPVVAFSLAAMLMGLAITFFAAPWGNRSFKDLVFQIAQSRADLGIKERVFGEPFDNVMVYVNSFSTRDRSLKDVLLVDRRDPETTSTIIAAEGQMMMHPENREMALHFRDGIIFLVKRDLGSARTIQFNTYSLLIGMKDMMSEVASRDKRPHELSVKEIFSELDAIERTEERRNQILRELYEKAAIPLGVFLMGIIGIPLGAQIRARGRTAGIGVSLLVFAVYYLCIMVVRSASSGGAISPVIGVWIPDLFLLLSALYLLHRASNERPFNPLARKARGMVPGGPAGNRGTEAVS